MHVMAQNRIWVYQLIKHLPVLIKVIKKILAEIILKIALQYNYLVEDRRYNWSNVDFQEFGKDLRYC